MEMPAQMKLIAPAELQDFLEQEFASIEPEFVEGLLLRSCHLADAEIQRADNILGVAKLPADFSSLISQYDFGNFSLLNIQFGVRSTGTLDWLLEMNDATTFGLEAFITELKAHSLILIANGEPYAILLNVKTGDITAVSSEESVAGRLPVASSFPQFIAGLGTAFRAQRKGRLADFRKLARQAFGEAAYPFWHGVTS